MMLVSATWKEQLTFKLIPVSVDCPYNEVIFDVGQKVLAIVSKEKKDTLHMIPRVNDLGEVAMVKTGKRTDGKPYAEQRVTMETYYEYFITDKIEIDDFINRFAVNATSFDYSLILRTAFQVNKVETELAES